MKKSWAFALHNRQSDALGTIRRGWEGAARGSALSIALVLALRSTVAPTSAAEAEIVHLAAQEAPAGGIEALLFRPATDRPASALVLLHGCGGLRDDRGRLGRRETDWVGRLTGRGFVVLLPDSFGSRGLGSQCRAKERTVRAWKERVDDARAAFDWLAGQSFVRADAIGLVGWSNGGSTVLQAVRMGRAPSRGDFRAAVAFYPGCRTMASNPNWRARVDVLILIGEADDWTPAAPCRDLVAAHADRLSMIAYPGAFHDFDAPEMPIRVRHGLAYTAEGGGDAHLGTDPAARADALVRVPDWLATLLR